MFIRRIPPCSKKGLEQKKFPGNTTILQNLTVPFIKRDQTGRRSGGPATLTAYMVKRQPSFDKQNRMCLFKNQFLKQLRFRPGKSQRYHISMLHATLYKLYNQCRIIGRIAKYPPEPRLPQPVILNRIVTGSRRPRPVHR